MRFGKNLFEKSRLESGLHPVGAWNRLKAGLQTRRTHSQLSFQTRSRRIVPGGVAILVLLFAPWAGYVHLAPATPLEAAAVPDIPMASLVPGQRIDAAIAVEPKKTGSSKSVRLFVKLRIAPGYYIYSLERSGKSSAPTSFEVNHRDGFSLSGPWKGPEPKRQTDGSKVYRGDVVFWNRFTASSAVPPGKHKISIKVSFQVCNDAVCWPPEKITRELELEIPPGEEKK